MASTFAVTRNHLIFGICLPVALLLGYLLADAQDPTSLVIVALGFGVLSFPLLIKWYHPALVLCWNMNAQPALPGQPELWAVMAFLTIGFTVLNRAMTKEARFAPVPALTLPLVTLLVIIAGTALLSGGFSVGALKSGSVGGKNYFYLVGAVVGYFVLSHKAIPRARAGFYVALFFLPGIMAAAPRVANLFGGKAAELVYLIWPPDFILEANATVEMMTQADSRLRGVATAATLVFFWLLARVGVRGIFDWTKPWQGGLFLLTLVGGALGGFRSVAIMMLLTFGLLFYMEKLWRTRIILVVVGVSLITGALISGFSEKMPLAIQRTLSFLPLELDPMVKISADDSSEWRLELWQEAWKQVPTYLFKGKGYTFNVDDMYMANYSFLVGNARNWEWALISGDYHNGPLSLLIPFGIYGLLAFLWLILAGCRYLYQVYRDGPPELRRINALLFAYFMGRAVFFFTIYGAVAHDLYVFTGILGLSVALNVPDQPKTEPLPNAELEPSPQI